MRGGEQVGWSGRDDEMHGLFLIFVGSVRAMFGQGLVDRARFSIKASSPMGMVV